MQYIVLDFEFNQGFDFINNKTVNLIPACRFEIIQIGAVKLNKDFQIIEKFNQYIKPTIYKEIHPYVQKITGIKKEFLEDKPSFIKVENLFNKFIGDDIDTIFCVWGKSDLRALYRNLYYYKLIENHLVIKYIDLQAIATKYLKFSKGGTIGLKSAIEKFEIPIKKDFHNALNDAIYTTEIFKILKDENIKIKIFNSKNIPPK